MPFPKIKLVEAKEKYRLYIMFSDANEGEFDVSHLGGKGVFKIWDVDENFSKVYINPDSGAITWLGELDIDTINVYCSIKGVDVDEYLNAKQHHATY